ncbi:hypothetical protein PEBR_39695 [Penicillium brasilianum]|uniref:Uncharacterized protein n=1 Tax=Penicillium brasilianum TaxID=104259 RepID=A0A1S9R9R0_PENBI|nr:hypothetical protein PEBR_39695 [Penicillium brasilianum]
MNQVLDFSKITSLERKLRRRRQRKALSQELKSSLLSAIYFDLYKPTSLFMVADEVAEGVLQGVMYNQRSTTSLDFLDTSLVAPEFPEDPHAVEPNAKVILDIAPTDGIYHAPPGAMRRIHNESVQKCAQIYPYRPDLPTVGGGRKTRIFISAQQTGSEISSRYVTDWYGLGSVSMSFDPIDLVVTDELTNETAISQSSGTMRIALLVLSDQYVGRKSVPVQYVIDRLCGLHKLRVYIFEWMDEASSLPMPSETNTNILSERTAWPLSHEVDHRGFNLPRNRQQTKISTGREPVLQLPRPNSPLKLLWNQPRKT